MYAQLISITFSSERGAEMVKYYLENVITKEAKKTGLIFNDKLDSQPFIMKSSDEQKIIREIWLLEKY